MVMLTSTYKNLMDNNYAIVTRITHLQEKINFHFAHRGIQLSKFAPKSVSASLGSVVTTFPATSNASRMREAIGISYVLSDTGRCVSVIPS